MAFATRYEITVVTDDRPDENMSDDALWAHQMLDDHGTVQSVAVLGVQELEHEAETTDLVEVLAPRIPSGITEAGEFIYGDQPDV